MAGLAGSDSLERLPYFVTNHDLQQAKYSLRQFERTSVIAVTSCYNHRTLPNRVDGRPDSRFLGTQPAYGFSSGCYESSHRGFLLQG